MMGAQFAVGGEGDKKESLSKVIGVGSVLYFIQNTLGKILGIASALLLVRFLGVFEYGLFVLARSMFDMFNSFSNIGIGSVVLTELNIARSEGKSGSLKAIFIDYTQLRALITTFFFLTLFLGTFILERFSENAVIPLARLFSILLILYFIRTTFSTLFNVYLKFHYQLYMGTIESVSYLIGLVIMVYWQQLGVEGAIYAAIISQIVVCAAMTVPFLRLYSRIGSIKRDADRRLWQILKAHGKWSVFENYSASITKNIRPWVAAAFLSVEAVAYFSIAQSLVGHLVSLVPLDKVLTPLIPLERNNRRKIGEIFFRSFKYSCYLMSCMAVGAFFTMPYFIHGFFPKYDPAIPIFNIILPVLIMTSFTAYLNIFFDTFRLQRDFFGLALVRAVFTIVIAVPLVSFFGIVGLAIEYLLTTFFFGAARYLWLLRKVPELKIPFLRIFTIDSVDRLIASKVFRYVRQRF